MCGGFCRLNCRSAAHVLSLQALYDTVTQITIKYKQSQDNNGGSKAKRARNLGRRGENGRGHLGSRIKAKTPTPRRARRGWAPRDLLVARVKITSYNHHCSAPFFRALVVQQLPSLLGRSSRQHHLISPRLVLRESNIVVDLCKFVLDGSHNHKQRKNFDEFDRKPK